MFWRRNVPDQVDEELDFHLDMVARDLIAQGWSEPDARAEARRRFGDLAEVRARCRELGLEHERRVRPYVVAQRTREIGIRMALGAARGEVVRLVLGRGLRIVAAGTALGLVAAYFGARAIEAQLFGVPAADAVTFVGVPLVLVAVAALACWLPARRAARVDPAVALSAE